MGAKRRGGERAEAGMRRRYFVLLSLVLAGCGGGGGTAVPSAQQALALRVQVLDEAVSNQPVPILVSVVRGGMRVEDYTGLVTFEMAHPAARYPAEYRFQPEDRGERAFATGFSLPGGVHVLTVAGEGINASAIVGISVKPRSVTSTPYVPPPVPVPPGPVKYFSLLQFASGGGYDTALSDLDGDGDPDLAIAGGGELGSNLDLWRNDGSGKFSKSSQIHGTPTFKVTSADVDGDGDNDLAVLCAKGSVWHAYILRNDGGGTFTETEDLGPASEFAFGDLTGDGYPDLVLMNPPSSVVIRANDGKGLFGAVLQSLAVYAQSRPGIADLDGDGDLDISTGGDVWRNDGKGMFVASGQSLYGGSGVVAEDLDGDGDVDLALGSYYGTNKLYLNNGTGLFTLSDGWQTGAYCTGDMAALDLDEDGDLDLLEGNVTTTLYVWMNEGGQFVENTELSHKITGGTHRLAVGDVDGDGDADFVSVATWLTVYRND
jgi:hypothetical protein